MMTTKGKAQRALDELVYSNGKHPLPGLWEVTGIKGDLSLSIPQRRGVPTKRLRRLERPKDYWKEEGYVDPIKKSLPYGKHWRDIDRHERPKYNCHRGNKGVQCLNRRLRETMEFDSTMGFPGEGPVCDCSLGVKCMIAGHYHQKRNKPLGGASRRAREESGGRKKPRVPEYVKCHRVANIQCCEDEHAHDETQCLDCDRTRAFVQLYQEQQELKRDGSYDSVTDNYHIGNESTDTWLDDQSDDGWDSPVVALDAQLSALDYEHKHDLDQVVAGPVVPQEELTKINTVVYPQGEEAQASIVGPPIYECEIFEEDDHVVLCKPETKHVHIFTTAPNHAKRCWLKDKLLGLLMTRSSGVVTNRPECDGLSSVVEMSPTEVTAYTSFCTGDIKWCVDDGNTCAEYFTKIYPTYYTGEVYVGCVDIALRDHTLARRRPVDPDGNITDVMTAVKHVVNTHSCAKDWIGDQRIYVNTLMYITNCVILRGLLEASANPRTVKTVFRTAGQSQMSPSIDPHFAWGL